MVLAIYGIEGPTSFSTGPAKYSMPRDAHIGMKRGHGLNRRSAMTVGPSKWPGRHEASHGVQELNVHDACRTRRSAGDDHPDDRWKLYGIKGGAEFPGPVRLREPRRGDIVALVPASRYLAASAALTARRPAISRTTAACRSAAGSSGLDIRQSRPRTIKYRPSGLTGYFPEVGVMGAIAKVDVPSQRLLAVPVPPKGSHQPSVVIAA